MSPTFGFCIAAYNRPRSLLRCVSSILREFADDPDVEIVITDDSDTTSVREQLGEVVQCGYVAYHRNARRLGYPENFNAALRLSTARWLVTFADDDLLLPGAARILREAIRILGSPGLILPGQEPWRVGRRTPEFVRRGPFEALLAFSGGPPSAIFFAREVYEALGGYAPDFLASDEELWARYLRCFPAVEIRGARLVWYSLHECNLGLRFIERSDFLDQYDRVSRRIAEYRGESGAEAEAFVSWRRRRAMRFALSRGLQLRRVDLVRRYALLLSREVPAYAPLLRLIAALPTAAIALFPLYRALRNAGVIAPLLDMGGFAPLTHG